VEIGVQLEPPGLENAARGHDFSRALRSLGSQNIQAIENGLGHRSRIITRTISDEGYQSKAATTTCLAAAIKKPIRNVLKTQTSNGLPGTIGFQILPMSSRERNTARPYRNVSPNRIRPSLLEGRRISSILPRPDGPRLFANQLGPPGFLTSVKSSRSRVSDVAPKCSSAQISAQVRAFPSAQQDVPFQTFASLTLSRECPRIVRESES
jgi:hypothetical protein